MYLKQVAIAGPNADTCTSEVFEFGLSPGKILVENEKVIICGGKGGIMMDIIYPAHSVADLSLFHDLEMQ